MTTETRQNEPAAAAPPPEKGPLPKVPPSPPVAPTTPNPGRKRLYVILAGVALSAVAAAAIYVLLVPPDAAWEACQAEQKTAPETRIRDCGAVIGNANALPEQIAVAYRKRARAYFDVGEIVSSVYDYDEALKSIKTDAGLYGERGAARLRNGDPARAVEDFNAALSIDPSLLEAMTGRGNAFLLLGQPEQAIQDFNAVITLNPSGADIFYRRAIAQSRLSRITDAAADYDKAIELAPKNPSYWNARCWFRATNGIDFDLALGDCDAALKLKAGFVPALDSRAFVLLRMGRLEEALKAYDAAIAKEVTFAWPYFGRGIVKSRLGDTAGAAADFAIAQRLQPGIEKEYEKFGETP